MSKIEIIRKISVAALCLQAAEAIIVVHCSMELAHHYKLHRAQAAIVLLITVLFMVAICLLQFYRYVRVLNQGVALMKQHRYEAAIALFSHIHQYFEKHPWVDKYRYVLLISCSAIPMKVMCVMNITACHVLLKNKELATFYYHTLVKLYKGHEIQLPWYDAFLNNKE